MITSKKPVLIAVYGMALILLSLVIHWTAPGDVTTALAAGTIGGVICLGLGGMGLMGWRFAAWTILTLVVISFILLSQTVLGWAGMMTDESPGLHVTLLLTVMLAGSIGLVAYLAHSAESQNLGPSQRSGS